MGVSSSPKTVEIPSAYPTGMPNRSVATRLPKSTQVISASLMIFFRRPDSGFVGSMRPANR